MGVFGRAIVRYLFIRLYARNGAGVNLWPRLPFKAAFYSECSGKSDTVGA